jgi:hypothetical protein
VITPPENQSRAELKKSLRSSLDAGKFNVKGISRASKNGIAVKCDNEESIDKLIQEVKDKFGENVEAARPKKVTPRIKMLRVNDPEQNDDEFLNILKQQNESLIAATLKVLRREPVKRNGQTIEGVFNIVMEIEEVSYEAVMTRKKLRHHFEIYKVVDNIYIRRCYKCWGFNHHRADCVNELACSSCSLSHESKECQAPTKKCINCVKFNERCGTSLDVNHDVWSNKCSVFKIKLERSKKIFAHIQ